MLNKKQNAQLNIKYDIRFEKKKSTLKKRNRKRYTNFLQLLVLGGSCFSPLDHLDGSVLFKCSIMWMNYFFYQGKKKNAEMIQRKWGEK